MISVAETIMRKLKFPVCDSHETASCWNCGGDFGDGHWSQTGFPHGRGEFSQACEKCGWITWYDLAAQPLSE